MCPADATFADPDTHPSQTLRAPSASATPLHSLPELHLGEGEHPSELRRTEQLGAGGMGEVWLARQTSLDRDVALKLLRPDAPASLASSLLREARVMGALEHPNIVPVHALGVDPQGRPVLVMKRVEGVSWRALLHDPAHPLWPDTGEDRLQRHVEVLIDVCRAVHFAHARGVLHRDLKPENVMVGAFGEVYLMDWGVATPLATPDTRAIVGTPAYMAPEQAAPNGPLDARTDTFLLGACLFEALTGHPPHLARAEHPPVSEVLARALAWPGASPQALNPPELGEIAVRALSPDPEGRFPSADALREALRAWIAHRAASVVVRAAEGRVEELLAELAAPSPSPARVDALLTEARFALRQAKQVWPGHPTADLTEARALVATLPHLIDRGDLEVAEALLAAHPSPPPDLRHRLDAARRARDEAHRLSLDLDPRVAQRERARFFTSIGLFFCAMTVYILGFMDLATYTTAEAARLSGLSVLAVLVSVGAGWRWVGSSFLNRQIIRSVLASIGMVALHRLLGVVLDTPVPSLLVGDLLIIAAVCLTATGPIARPFQAASLPFVAGAAVSAWRPELAVTSFGLAGSSATLMVGALLWRGAAQEAGGASPASGGGAGGSSG